MSILRVIPLRPVLLLVFFSLCAGAAFVLKQRATEARSIFAAAASGGGDLRPAVAPQDGIEAAAAQLTAKLVNPSDRELVKSVMQDHRAAVRAGAVSRRLASELEFADLVDVADLACDVRTERGRDGRVVIRADVEGQVRLKGVCWTTQGGERLELNLRSTIFSLAPLVSKTTLEEVVAASAGGDVILGKKRGGRLSVDWLPPFAAFNHELDTTKLRLTVSNP